jgi:hypothetical protein
VNSFAALDAPLEPASLAELDSSLTAPLPTEAAFALGALCEEEEEEEEEDEDESPARARSGPNSRLALSAGVSACVDVAADAASTLDRPAGAPSVGATPDTSPANR